MKCCVMLCKVMQITVMKCNANDILCEVISSTLNYVTLHVISNDM